MPDPTYAVPSETNAGDTLAFLVSAPDTPATTYTGAAKLFGPQTLAGTVAASGADFLVTFAAAEMAKLSAGDYRFAVTATLASARYTIATGAIRVNLDPGTVTADGGLEDCQRKLTLIRSAIAGRLTTDHESYSIGTRSIAKIPILQLVKLEVVYAARVRALQNKGKPRASMVAQFVTPGVGIAS